MLVLGRRVNDSVVIGDGIVVTVLAVEGERVKIGIQAPSDVQIMRQELYETLKEENLRAAESASSDIQNAILPSLRALLQHGEKSDGTTD